MRQYAPISGIAQLKDLPLLGLIFQGDSKSSSHVKIKLTKANKCLHVLKTSRKEQYNQDEIDHMFKATVLINVLYGLLDGASDSDLSLVQCFLKRCHKRYFISYPVDIFSLLESQDRSIFRKSISIDGHPLSWIVPERKETKYKLRMVGCLLPKVNTESFGTTFVNRLN